MLVKRIRQANTVRETSALTWLLFELAVFAAAIRHSLRRAFWYAVLCIMLMVFVPVFLWEGAARYFAALWGWIGQEDSTRLQWSSDNANLTNVNISAPSDDDLPA